MAAGEVTSAAAAGQPGAPPPAHTPGGRRANFSVRRNLDERIDARIRADAALRLFRCKELDLLFTPEECALRQGARHATRQGGQAGDDSLPAFSPCGRGKCEQGARVLVALGMTTPPVTVIPPNTCGGKHEKRTRAGTVCKECFALRKERNRLLDSLAGREWAPAVMPGEEVHKEDASKPDGNVDPCARPEKESAVSVNDCISCGGPRRGQRGGKHDDGLCGGCRARDVANATGDKDKARAFIKSHPELPARRSNRPSLPDPRIVPDDYLIACVREVRRRVEMARALAAEVDRITSAAPNT